MIFNDCDKNDNSFSNLGFTYTLPGKIKFKSGKAVSYLGGLQKFKVIELEVFKVIKLS